MGKGYYFNMDTSVKAKRAANLFAVQVFRRYRNRTSSLGITLTIGGRYIAGVDVCGAPNKGIDEIYQEVVSKVNNGR